MTQTNDELVNEALNNKRQVVFWARKSSKGALLVSLRHIYDEIHDLKVLDLANEKLKDMELTGDHQPLTMYIQELRSKAHEYTLKRMKNCFKDYCTNCDIVYQISEGHTCINYCANCDKHYPAQLIHDCEDTT